METTSRAVSAKSTGFSPPTKRTVLMRNADTQTESVQRPEEMPPEVLFAPEDVPDECQQESYADYRTNTHWGEPQVQSPCPLTTSVLAPLR